MRTGARRMAARAIAIRWRCPLESVTPRSPTMVSYPLGSASTNAWALARRAGGSVPPGRGPRAAERVVCRTVSAGREVCLTDTHNLPRRADRVLQIGEEHD